VRASKAGDVAAFEELVKRYDSKLLRIAQHVTHNREDAQDAVQEAFLKAFRKLEQFQENSQFSTWLFRITVNESLMKLRKQRRQREVSIDQDFQVGENMFPREIADLAPNPEERYRARESREILIKTLQQLGPGLRVVFVLRHIEGLSLEQTAKALDLTVSAVKARSWRARLQVRERLNKYFRKTETLVAWRQPEAAEQFAERASRRLQTCVILGQQMPNTLVKQRRAWRSELRRLNRLVRAEELRLVLPNGPLCSVRRSFMRRLQAWGSFHLGSAEGPADLAAETLNEEGVEAGSH
jgi:RNA polymerase sigma-70 factor, ECF subfamily